MLERITGLVNDALSTLRGSPRVTPQEVIDLIDCGGSAGGPQGRHWVSLLMPTAVPVALQLSSGRAAGGVLASRSPQGTQQCCRA